MTTVHVEVLQRLTSDAEPRLVGDRVLALLRRAPHLVSGVVDVTVDAELAQHVELVRVCELGACCRCVQLAGRDERGGYAHSTLCSVVRAPIAAPAHGSRRAVCNPTSRSAASPPHSLRARSRRLDVRVVTTRGDGRARVPKQQRVA